MAANALLTIALAALVPTSAAFAVSPTAAGLLRTWPGAPRAVSSPLAAGRRHGPQQLAAAPTARGALQLAMAEGAGVAPMLAMCACPRARGGVGTGRAQSLMRPIARQDQQKNPNSWA